MRSDSAEVSWPCARPVRAAISALDLGRSVDARRPCVDARASMPSGAHAEQMPERQRIVASASTSPRAAVEAGLTRALVASSMQLGSLAACSDRRPAPRCISGAALAGAAPSRRRWRRTSDPASSRLSSSPLDGPVDRLAIMRAQHGEAQHLARPVRRSSSRMVTKLPSDLRHLLAFDLQEAVVHPVRSPSPACAEGAARLRDLVLVVRKDEVDAAAVDVEGLAEMLPAHRRALDVPAGPARRRDPDGRRPAPARPASTASTARSPSASRL